MEPKVPITFEGNNYDLMAVAGVLFAGGVLMSCVPGLYCIWPFLPGILGIVALLTADQSVDPSRTRKLSWVAIAATGFYFLIILAIIFIYVALFGVLIATAPNP